MDMPNALQRIQQGSVVRMDFVPPQQNWKKFELVTEIAQFIPNKELKVRLRLDQRGKITALFSELSWKIELEPRADGHTLVRGSITGHTASARARILAGLAKRILMNQVFYVDIQKLAEITQPHGVILTPAAQQ